MLVWGYHLKQEATSGVLSIIHGKYEAHIYPAYTSPFLHPSCLLTYYVIIYVEISTKIVELVIQVLFFRTSSSTYLLKIGNSLMAPSFISCWLPGIQHSQDTYMYSTHDQHLIMGLRQKRNTPWFTGHGAFWSIEIHMLLQVKCMNKMKNSIGIYKFELNYKHSGHLILKSVWILIEICIWKLIVKFTLWGSGSSLGNKITAGIWSICGVGQINNGSVQTTNVTT